MTRAFLVFIRPLVAVAGLLMSLPAFAAGNPCDNLIAAYKQPVLITCRPLQPNKPETWKDDFSDRVTHLNMYEFDKLVVDEDSANYANMTVNGCINPYAKDAAEDYLKMYWCSSQPH